MHFLRGLPALHLEALAGERATWNRPCHTPSRVINCMAGSWPGSAHSASLTPEVPRLEDELGVQAAWQAVSNHLQKMFGEERIACDAACARAGCPTRGFSRAAAILRCLCPLRCSGSVCCTGCKGFATLCWVPLTTLLPFPT